MKHLTQAGLWAGLVLLMGCSSIDLEETNSAGVSFSGDWRLDFSASDPTPDFKQGFEGQRRRRPPTPESVAREDQLGALGSGLAFIVHDFQVLRADTLEIEQSRDSMGVRYTPGVYRDISWGERERGLWEVHAGWDGSTLMVISMADKMRVTERFNRSGNQLTIDITIVADGDQQDVRRVYNLRS